MQSDDKYIDKPDDFSKKVGEKLREHQMPVDSDVWNSLTDRLPSPKRPVFTYWSWVAAGVAAAVLVLVLFNPLVDEPLLTEHSQFQKQIEQDTIVPEIISNETDDRTEKELYVKQIVDYNSRKPEKKIRAAETTELAEVSKPVEIAKSTEITKPEEVMIPERTKPDEIGVLATTVKLEESSKAERTLYPGEPPKSDTIGLSEQGLVMQEFLAEEFPMENDLSSPVQKQQGVRSLIAALGSGSAPLDFSLGSYDARYPQYDSHFPGGDFNNGGGTGLNSEYNILNPGDYTDIEHRLPVSFSLTADFPIAGNISLETGLSYTYLFSRYRRNDDFIYRGTLRQHYIGIPVNLRYTVWQNDAWNVYLLGGGSIEKGLRSVYKQEIEYNGGIVYHTNLYSRIKGFQFSAQGGAGFSYRLQGNLSLFGEPRIIYYFKNNQPMSARTENPLIFGLNMGIRLQFK